MPRAFTEQGASMLSAVLRSDTAIDVSVRIMDSFVEMRHFVAGNAAMTRRMQQDPELHFDKWLFIYRYCSTEYAAYSLLGEEDAAKLPLEQFKGFVLTSELDNRQTLLQINSFSRFPFKAISDLSAYTNIFDVVKIAKAASDVAKVIIRKLSSLLEPCWNLLEPVGPSKLTVRLLSQAQQNAFTRTLLELTRICGAELALLASPEICFGADLAPWSAVVICDCQRAKSVCLYSAHSAPIQLQRV